MTTLCYPPYSAGTTPDQFVWQILGADGTVLDLSGTSEFPVDQARFVYRLNGGTPVTSDGSLVNLALGEIAWVPSAEDFAVPGILEGTAFYASAGVWREGPMVQITIVKPLGGPPT